MSDLKDLITNVQEKSAEIEEVGNGFVLVVSYTSEITGFERRKYIYTDWDEMISELSAWFIGSSPEA